MELVIAHERALGARDGRWLVPGGALFGLALQTHPSVLAIVPGVALTLWWRGRSLLTSQWALLGGIALLIGCANLLIQIPRTEFSVGQFARDTAALHDGQYPGGAAYLDAVGSASPLRATSTRTLRIDTEPIVNHACERE